MTNKIKELRINAGLTLQQLSDKTNIGKSTLASYESRGVEPRVDKAKILADYFGVSIAYLSGIEKSDDKEIQRVLDLESKGDHFGLYKYISYLEDMNKKLNDLETLVETDSDKEKFNNTKMEIAASLEQATSALKYVKSGIASSNIHFMEQEKEKIEKKLTDNERRLNHSEKEVDDWILNAFHSLTIDKQQELISYIGYLMKGQQEQSIMDYLEDAKNLSRDDE
ncbi:helix-turn-helix domain-containing protein [Lactococcus allomyrinae]|nr:helix-turn-helix transcriptional regulator [Lactococcus allomyrinae]